jgi:hypothetical protein
MPRTFTAVLLLAALALPPGAKAVAGPPEKVSGKMVLDEVAERLRKYRAAGRNPATRNACLGRLIATRDVRALLVVGEELNDPDLAVADGAGRLLWDYYFPLPSVGHLPRQKWDDGERTRVRLRWAECEPIVRNLAKQHPGGGFYLTLEDLRRRTAHLPR